MERSISYSLANDLKEATRCLHKTAEETGVVSDIIKKRVSLSQYVLYLRNLLPVYRAIENARHCSPLRASGLLCAPVLRSERIASDLEILCDQSLEESLPVMSSTKDYVAQINDIIENSPVALLGHIYVRYLGDMHGGQILQRILSESLDISAPGLSFYRFEAIADIKEFRSRYRRKFDSIEITTQDKQHILKCGIAGFKHNIALSADVNKSWSSQHRSLTLPALQTPAMRPNEVA